MTADDILSDSAETPGRKSAAKKPSKSKAAPPAPEPAAEAPAKPAKKPAVKKTKGAKAPEAELLFSSDRDDAPEAAPAKPAKKAVAPAETPTPAAPAPAFVPPITVSDPRPVADKPAGRGEAVEFDPGAILAKFAPKEDERPPRPETGEAGGEILQAFSTESGAASETKPADPETPAVERPQQHPGNRPHHQHHQQRHPNDRRDDRRQGGGQSQQQQGNGRQHQQQPGNGRQQPQPNGRHPNDRHGGNGGNGKNPKFAQRKQWPGLAETDTAEEQTLELGEAFDYGSLNRPEIFAEALAAAEAATGEPLLFNELYAAPVNDIVASARNIGLKLHRTPQRRELVGLILEEAGRQGHAVNITGTLELLDDGNGLLVYGFDNYRVRELSAFVPKLLIKKHGLLRGHEIEAVALPAKAGETAPMIVKVLTVMGADPEEVMRRTPFTELTPYYPTRRMLLETDNAVGWDNLSMRCVDLLCPIGLGQRGLIVAPPRTGKTVLMQAIANSISRNNPDVHLIVLLVDERPEEVTDFRRNSAANEVVSSTFDENAESHVHAAEMVIERARRMVEAGRHVVILLDSITRLARAYNTMVPSTGKILSGGVEAGALTRPKRFFGSARNIEGGGSLTILGTALVDTGSKMDEVIFEEFKGTGNMELDLDRDLANKRIFPAINFERSGTRKEELIYHPDEMAKVYALRRAMKGVPSVEAMEMLITRIKKTKSNAEFLVTLSR